VASYSKRLPRLGPRLPTLPALQSFSPHRHSSWQLHPPANFLHIQTDLFGPLSSSAEFQYCLTAVDHFTRWPEAFPIPYIRAECRALLSGWISRFGCPQTIMTNQGFQFESQLFHNLVKLGVIHLCRMTPTPRSQLPCAMAAPHAEDRHHVPCGQAVDQVPATSPHGAAATNPGSMPFVPGHIRPQGSPGLDPCIPAAGRHMPSLGNTVQRPALTKHLKLSCAAGRSLSADRVKPTYVLGLGVSPAAHLASTPTLQQNQL
jgi:hypothetical protein